MQVSLSESSDDLDWHSTKCKRKRTCIKCGEGGKVLSCEKCPVEIHRFCMSCPAQFDAEGRFHCPYCLYKQSVQEWQRAKEKLIMVNNAISYLMAKEHDNGQTPIAEGWIVKILSMKLEEQKQESTVQSTRSNFPHDEIDGLAMDEETDTSASVEFKQIQHNNDSVIVNQARLDSHVCGKSCAKEPTDISLCEVEQEKGEKGISKALEVEETIQVKCYKLDDSYQVKKNSYDEEQVEQPDTLYEEGGTIPELVVQQEMTKNHDCVKVSGNSSLLEGKELKLEETQEESQGSCVYPVKKRRVIKIKGNPDNLDDNCSSCQDHCSRKHRAGCSNGARDGNAQLQLSKSAAMDS